MVKVKVQLTTGLLSENVPKLWVVLSNFNICLALCVGITDTHNQHQHIKSKFLHVFIFFSYTVCKGKPFLQKSFVFYAKMY